MACANKPIEHHQCSKGATDPYFPSLITSIVLRLKPSGADDLGSRRQVRMQRLYFVCLLCLSQWGLYLPETVHKTSKRLVVGLISAISAAVRYPYTPRTGRAASIAFSGTTITSPWPPETQQPVPDAHGLLPSAADANCARFGQANRHLSQPVPRVQTLRALLHGRHSVGEPLSSFTGVYGFGVLQVGRGCSGNTLPPFARQLV